MAPELAWWKCTIAARRSRFVGGSEAFGTLQSIPRSRGLTSHPFAFFMKI